MLAVQGCATQRTEPQVAAQAPAAEPASLPRTITVVGLGSVKIEPDIAQASIGVETVGATVRTATTEATSTMDSVMAALKGLGIADKDIQTSGYSVWADRNPSPLGEGVTPQEPVYHVNNMVTVVIRKLDSVGAVLDASIEAGANSIYGVSFSIDKPEALESQARELAVADALKRAQELAALNQLMVGPVVSISEVVTGGSYESNFSSKAFATAGYGGGGGGEISPGELELSLRLQIVYAIQ
jgi:hypothetical protein